jgi:hypothetical protein
VCVSENNMHVMSTERQRQSQREGLRVCVRVCVCARLRVFCPGAGTSVCPSTGNAEVPGLPSASC